jgi:DnaJ-class molecular chaperone
MRQIMPDRSANEPTTNRDWFEDAAAIAQEHNPPITGGKPLLQRCPTCLGDGEIQHAGESVNPSSGVRGRDPQMDVSEECHRCGGTGAINVAPPAAVHSEEIISAPTTWTVLAAAALDGDRQAATTLAQLVIEGKRI